MAQHRQTRRSITLTKDSVMSVSFRCKRARVAQRCWYCLIRVLKRDIALRKSSWAMSIRSIPQDCCRSYLENSGRVDASREETTIAAGQAPGCVVAASARLQSVKRPLCAESLLSGPTGPNMSRDCQPQHKITMQLEKPKAT